MGKILPRYKKLRAGPAPAISVRGLAEDYCAGDVSLAVQVGRPLQCLCLSSSTSRRRLGRGRPDEVIEGETFYKDSGHLV